MHFASVKSSAERLYTFLNMEEEVEKFERVFKPKEKKYEIDFKRSKGVDFETSSLYIVALEFTIKINLKEDYES